MKTIFHIVGNRPQFIKLAVLYKELATNNNFKQEIIHSGQHFSANMSDVFFKELQIPSPVVNFNIQKASANIFIGETAEKIQEFLLKQDDPVVMVYGDTNTTLAASIAAKRLSIPLLHFEAGVRTGEMSMPEELNRLLTDRLANVNYCCTQKNLQQLKHEGYGIAISSAIEHTGDLMLDAFMQIPESIEFVVPTSHYIVATIHRASNLSNKKNLQNIIEALNEIHQQQPVVMPIHPHTQKKIEAYNFEVKFTLLDPLGYPAMKKLLSNSNYIITDSGGTSREAYFLRKKSLIIMENPFWPEIIDSTCALHTAAEKKSILESFYALETLQPDFDSAIFGNGNAAAKIHSHLKTYLA